MQKHESIIRVVCGYLEEDGCPYRVLDAKPCLEADYRGETARYRTVIFVSGEATILLGVLLLIPEIVAERQRDLMTEAIVRANGTLSLGAFHLDMCTGDTYFHVSMPVGGELVSGSQFRALLGAAFWGVDHYHRAFNRLLFGDDLLPAEVIAEVEMAE